MFSKLPIDIIDHIYTFDNTEKVKYKVVMKNLKNYFMYRNVLNQLKTYSTYDINKNFIKFQIDSILETY
jgi:hypothetical protein